MPLDDDRPGRSRPHPAQRLRELLDGDEAVLCPGVVSPLFAQMAARAGFETLYATGAGISNMWLGMPDLGLAGMSEVLAVTSRIIAAVDVPVLADVDTGYGNALNVTRTVQEYERAGAAGIQLEDQVNPKRCGHFDQKEVAAPQEMVERIIAATEARRDPRFVIVARTDAAAVEGLDAALGRARLYARAGADALFVEAPRTREELAIIGRELDLPLVANMVEGGKTPLLSADELGALGYRLVLYANTTLRMSMSAVARGFDALLRDRGTASLLGDMATWEERQGAVDLDRWLATDADVQGRAEDVTKRFEAEGKR